MKKGKLFLLILVAWFTACNHQTNMAASAPTEQAIPSDSADAVEVIVFTWDWPMEANIPPIHIWKDNRAIWVDWEEIESLQYRWYVYETVISQEEMLRVQEVLSTAGFWKKAQPEAEFTPASWLFVWASDGNQEGVVHSPMFDNTEVTDLLQEILESSTNKKEYFPQSGYLFITGTGDKYPDDDTYLWPDDSVPFEFDAASQGVYVDGKVISTIWNAVQQGAFQIKSKKGTYQYDLKIPGMSCVISTEPYMCNMYSAESP